MTDGTGSRVVCYGGAARLRVPFVCFEAVPKRLAVSRVRASGLLIERCATIENAGFSGSLGF